MPHAAAARMATRERDAGRYQRHRSEQTLLYRIVDECYPAFAAHLAEQGRELPGYVQREEAGEHKAGEQMPAILAAAHERARHTLLGEIHRLKALRRINPNVRDAEIHALERHWQAVNETLEGARLRLEALRVLVVT